MRYSSRRRSRGLVIVPVLLVFIVIVLIGGVLLKLALAQREQVVDDERRLQAEWLVESGLDRAAARLSASPAYAGETWSITPQELGTRWPGTVTIQVEKDKTGPDARHVTIVATYPRDGGQRNRQRKQVTLNVGLEKPRPSS